jgi:hypothetical protein
VTLKTRAVDDSGNLETPTAGVTVSVYDPGQDHDFDGFPGPQDCDDGDATVYPGAPELCDGKDNDCDTVVDEGNPESGGGCGTGEPGVCAAGTEQCIGGGLQCVANTSPSGEQCNGLDDDCDGSTDEGNPGGGGACGVSSVGACELGTLTCQGGSLTCVGAINPVAEQCNGLDDDCDGSTDEGNPGGGGGCATGQLGVCAAGTQQCLGGGLQCVANSSPSTEQCDGLDNDCDGSVDEGTSGASCNTGQPGACAAGTEQCQSGTLVCVAQTPPTAESCNGIDDDCDGSTDEGNPGGGGNCVTGQPGVCSAGTLQCQGGLLLCVANAAQAETCDGLDNDCDGAVDEGNPGGGASCGTGELGECAFGSEQCQGGALMCVGPAPSAEVCDGADNDCDGSSDESLGQTTCGLGECEMTVDNCVAGVPQSCIPGLPGVELCDGLDNDCDGVSDDECLASLCGSAPVPGCLVAGRASLQIRDHASSDDRDQVKWKWGRGDDSSATPLGDPLATTAYVLCLYDSSAGVPVLVSSLQVDPNGAWRDKEPKGWSYKDKAGAFDGVQKMQIRRGTAGKSKAQVSARGTGIPMASPASPEQYFAVDPSVTVQLINTEGACWTSDFTTASKNAPDRFKAKEP